MNYLMADARLSQAGKDPLWVMSRRPVELSTLAASCQYRPKSKCETRARGPVLAPILLFDTHGGVTLAALLAFSLRACNSFMAEPSFELASSCCRLMTV